MVSASDGAPEVPGFADHLGDRFIVPQPSGSLLELLYFRTDLATAPFFDGAVKQRLARLANFRHSSYTRVRRFQRGDDRGGIALVSTHIPGRRLAEVLQVTARAGLRPPVPAILAVTRQVMTAAALMHDYGPDIFHGAITPERLILAGDGRIVVCEYVLGGLFEQAAAAWGVPAVWRDWRVPMLADTQLGRYGRRVDLSQIGLVTLALLVGRPLSGPDYPEGLGRLIDEACDAAEAGGWPAQEARAWLAAMLVPEGPDAFRTLVEAQKAFGTTVQAAAAAGEPSPAALQAFVDQCEGAAWKAPGEVVRPATPTPVTLMSAAAMLDAVSASAGPANPEPAAALSADLGTVEQTVNPEMPAIDWFTPGPGSLQDEAADSCESVPAFSLDPHPDPGALLPGFDVDRPSADRAEAAAPEPETPPAAPLELTPDSEREWALDAVSEFPLHAADVTPGEPAADVATAIADDMPSAAADAAAAVPRFDAERAIPEPAPPEPQAKEAVSFQPPAPAPPSVTPSVVASSSWQTPAAADNTSTSRRTRAPRPRALSGRREGRWRTLAVAIGAILVLAAGAFVAPIAWTRMMGAGLPTGRLAVESNPAGAEVMLDGKSVGRTPVSVEAAAGQHHVEVRIAGSSRAAWVTVPENERLVHKVAMPEAALRGGLQIATNPPGGEVWIDGASRGKAPVRVDDLTPGTHRLSASGPFGPIEEQEVSVAGGAVTPVTVPTVGWIRVRSPFPLRVSEKGRVFGETSGQSLMVPVGRHHFDLANPVVALKVRQFAEVRAGNVVTLPFDPPMGMMNLTADEPAEVWIDGRLIGQTPQTTLPAALGSHEVVFRHPQLGDVSYTVNVTLAAPVRLTVTFNKKRNP